MASFTPDTDISDLSGKVIIVTGGNIGLGAETILQLSKHGPAHIYLAARNAEKAEAAIASIKKANPSAAPISHLQLDLSSFSSISAAAQTFNSASQRLDILINNAGIMACPPALTKEGYETQFGTNHMGHALLTKLLLPTLQRTAKEQGATADVRVINLTSGAHAWSPKQGLVLDDAKSEMRGYSAFVRYGHSKLANVHFTRELAARHPELKVVAIHPGAVQTNLISGPMASWPTVAWLLKLASPLVLMSVAKGALNQLWAATAPSAQVKSGVMYYPVAKETKGSAHAQNVEASKKLWDWTEEELKTHGY